MSMSVRRMGRSKKRVVTASSVSFVPSSISLSAPEIPNSGRGQYYWLGMPADPANWPLVDTYYRDQIPWRAVELSPGVYDLTLIEAGLAEATRRGGRFGFRIMPYFDSSHIPELQPSWIPSLPTKNSDGSPGAAKAPDWNSTIYLNSWSAMIARVGQSFNADPRLFYMDISGYGMTGEWYRYNGEFQQDITQSSAETICDAAINAFPDTYVLAPAMDPGFTYAQTASTKVGSRFDYLGCMDLSYQGLAPRIAGGWKIAPLVTEWGNDAANFSVTKGIQNIRDMRVSLVSSGNKPIATSAMTPSDQQLFDQANKIAGFRYSLTQIDLATNLTAGQPLTVTTTWRNDGVAPTYDAWRTQLVFLMASGAEWTVDLTDDLRQVLGTEVLTKSFTSTIAVPTDLPAGTCTAGIRIVDPRGQLSPLSLATVGRDSRGNYPVGTVTIAVGTSSPSDSTAPMAPVITSGAITPSLSPLVTGTAEPGSSVRVVVNGRAHLTTATNGTWSIAPLNYFSTGVTYPISVTATDARGNVSPAATQSLEIRGTSIASDTFDRSDSSTPGSLTTGQAWTVQAGAWTIAANKLVPAPSGEHFITVNAGTRDVTVGVDITGIGTSKWMGPIARYVDANNMYMLEVSEGSGQVNFFKRVNGNVVYLGMCRPPAFSRLALKIRSITDGVLMIAIADGAVAGHAIDVTAPFPTSNLVGIHYGGFGTPGPAFDNFRVEAI